MTGGAVLWFQLYPLLAAPLCAALAGLATWLLVRGTQPRPGELLRHFLVSYALLLMVSYAILTAAPVQRFLYGLLR